MSLVPQILIGGVVCMQLWFASRFQQAKQPDDVRHHLLLAHIWIAVLTIEVLK